MSHWYQLTATEVLQQLNSNPAHGLTEAEAARRLEQYGPNALIEQVLKSPWKILLEQLTNVMTIILIVAAIISFFLGDLLDAGVILAIVVLNAALGFRQEYKAEKSMAALKQLAVPIVKVRREGQVKEISSLNLVPGDIVILETGNKVPADGRLLESPNLRLEEAALTGESEAVEKDAEAVYSGEEAMGDRRNMVYMGTVISYGHGLAVVTTTGMQTELGHIANLMQTVEQEPTPLQQRLNRLGLVLAVAALVIVGVIFAIGLWRGDELSEVFLTAVSLAVAAVPEGLAAVVTVALSLGAQRMLQRHALIRKLPAVETLGSVTVICSDKTGTLTQNKMTVTVLDIANQRIDLTEKRVGAGLEVVKVADSSDATPIQPTLDLLLIGGALCNDAVLQSNPQKPGIYQVVGDSTEGALLLAAAEFGLLKKELDQCFPRVAELPFESVRKRMTTVHRRPQSADEIPPRLVGVWSKRPHPEAGFVAFTKGAIDGLLNISNRVWVEGRLEPLDEAWRQRIMAAHDGLAQNGMRVLGVGLRPLEAVPAEKSLDTLEQDLILLGLFGMIDPPRPEVKAAIATCRTAGIRPVMITGDHPLTARYIGAELGIGAEDGFLTGQELDQLSPEKLAEAAGQVSVFARVAPEHKLDLVEIYQKQGHIVAMTGDGVNDAPALKKADIGVAMGITGTDVAKEAADMVLLDDNFATIVAAVEEGRTIFDNIRKFIAYLLSCNSSELGVMLLGPLLGMPLPLLPLQILWMNLVTDGLPALALSVEPAERNIMRRPPHSTTGNIFGRSMVRIIISMGLVMTIVSLGLGYAYWQAGQATWQTMIFTTLVMSQVFFALAIRSERDSLFTIGLGSNRAMIGAVLSTFLLQLAVIYIPFLQPIFETTPLSLPDLALALGLSTVVFWVSEVEKLIRRQRERI
ncbi:MAG: ATPase [Anaerolineae bacterium]|nr:cation-translocating P-type ATPase [Anaerolineales bacterium]MCQ3977929.1 ATPase [Anaerolineae bacterium]